MLVEATRDSRHAALYEEVAGQTLTVTGDEETAREDLKGVFDKLELDRVQSEYRRLTASGVRDERYQQLSKRLAELKGAVSGGETRARA